MAVTIKEEYYHWVLPLCRSLLPHAMEEFFMREHLEWYLDDSTVVFCFLAYGFFLRVKLPNLKIIYSNLLFLKIVLYYAASLIFIKLRMLLNCLGKTHSQCSTMISC